MTDPTLANPCEMDVFPDHPEWNVKCNREKEHKGLCARFEILETQDAPIRKFHNFPPLNTEGYFGS